MINVMSVSWQTVYTLRTYSIPSFSQLSPPHPPWRLISTFSFSDAKNCCCRCRCSVAGRLEEKMQKINKSEQKPTTPIRVDFQEREDDIPSQIQVRRQRYIPVSKSELLDALLSMLRSQQIDDGSIISHFLLLSSCLDSILHAEHKCMLEEMRSDYSRGHSGKNQTTVTTKAVGEGKHEKGSGFTRSRENGSVKSYSDGIIGSENQLPFYHHVDLIRNFGSSANDMQKNIVEKSSVCDVAIATRFQRSFMKLLHDAQFEELSVRDLMLTSALNADYLLNLPIYVDWKKASESNAIIFRRGYATEKQKGLLIVEKLDYLQSKLLQELFSLVSKPLRKFGLWILKVMKSATTGKNLQFLGKRFKIWFEESSLFQQSYSYQERTSDVMSEFEQELDNDLPIWLAAQRAVSLYEGFMSSVGPRGRLLKKFLVWVGLIPSTPETTFELGADNIVASEPYLRPISLSRISLSDIWRPATRKYCGNDIWRMLRAAISIFFSPSVLQEPAFQELILLYTEETNEDEMRSKVEIPSLQLKIYEKIPIPDLPVIFPHKKLSFRILDTVRLDIATLIGFLAYFINYKFEDVLSSPSAILLDVISMSALIIYVSRVALGYKQTRDRYQLLVNQTLYEKTLASGFGSVHFLLDASEQQSTRNAFWHMQSCSMERIDRLPVEALLGKNVRGSCMMFSKRR
ncbi:hypothetical protein Nepgr_005809 [Nepenthes gracilis]|uniref:Uncharacterized protein n=1 Tax=Nepenthes gracilis TaxID=150966 RepID=A0AAD3S3V8_NEPGR|nr:hypothetical protein Nepgr_005809 [Nepenthes gracilis]